MISKAKFLVKINNLKKSGKMIKLMRATSEWIDDNIDTLYENFLKTSNRFDDSESKKRVMRQFTARSKMMSGSKNITKKQFSILYEKQQLKQKLLDAVENYLLKKFTESKSKNNAHIQKHVDPHREFIQKQFFVESNIGKVFKFFSGA